MELRQVNEALQLYIRPQTFPIALKLCRSESEIPERVRMPMRDLGYQIALCQAIGLARRFRWPMAVGKEDQCCAGGASAMGFIADRPEDDRAKRLEYGKYTHLLVAPTEAADFDPDVIAIYGSSAQIMRLVQAARRGVESGVSAVATGGGDCGDIVARTTLSEECQCILPSGGDRAFGGTQDHEMIFSMPPSKVEAVLKGLEESHRAGFRYPILTDLRHPPMLPPGLQMPKTS